MSKKTSLNGFHSGGWEVMAALGRHLSYSRFCDCCEHNIMQVEVSNPYTHNLPILETQMIFLDLLYSEKLEKLSHPIAFSNCFPRAHLSDLTFLCHTCRGHPYRGKVKKESMLRKSPGLLCAYLGCPLLLLSFCPHWQERKLKKRLEPKQLPGATAESNLAGSGEVIKRWWKGD